MSQYKDKVQKQIKQKAFSYVDVIYGMTIIMIILGVIFGSIRMVERRLRENQLIILADSFANKIFDEVRLRKYDENIASILDNGLTKVFDVEEGEDQGDWSSFDDIDDFHGITATDLPSHVWKHLLMLIMLILIQTIRISLYRIFQLY